MPHRVPQLPLPAFLTALDAWRARPEPEEGGNLERELGSLLERTGFLGALVVVDAPPLAAVEIRAGTLAADGEPDDDGHSRTAELTLLTGTGTPQLGTVRLHGLNADMGRAPELANAIATAVEAVRDRERARRAELNLAALDDAVRGVAQLLDIDLVLQRVVNQVRELVDADYAALGIFDEDGVIQRFITSGISQPERERIGDLPQGRGLLGLIIQEGRAYRVADIMTDERRHGFPPNHPEMHPFLGAPIPSLHKTIGNLYLTRAGVGRPFTAEDQRLVDRFALHAGIAIENARLHDRVQRLAIVEERERIGRDLHDRIIQRLYGLTLALDDVPHLVVEAPGDAQQRIEDAIEALTATIQEIRTFVFGLRPVELDERGLVGALEQLAGEVHRSVGLEVSVRVEPGIDPPMEHVAELLSVARESLTNIARHAEARAAEVDLSDDGSAFRLEVIDDGVGFDPAAAIVPGHHGLANMRERAARMDGMLEVGSEKGRGTRIILTLPHRPTTDGRDERTTEQDQ